MKKIWIVAIVALVGAALTSIGPVRAQTAPEPIASGNVSLISVLPGTTGAIGARFKDNEMFLTTSSGLQTYNISDPANPTLLGALPLPHFENEDVDLGSDILLISNDAAESTGILYVIDISDPETPNILSAFPMGGDPIQGGPGHTASCILDCKFAWVTDGGGIRVIDLTDPRNPVVTGVFETAAGGDVATHDVQVDGNGLAWVVGFGGAIAYEIPDDYDGSDLGTQVAKTNEEGFSTYLELFGLGDGSEYNDYILHNSRRLKNKGVVYVTEEDYTRPGCSGAGAFETWKLPVEKKKVDGKKSKVPTGADLKPMDQWVVESLSDPEGWKAAPPASALCSAHYFDVKRNVVAQGWYEQGLRLLDVSDPRDIRQLGYFIPPEGIVWAAYFAPTDPNSRIIYNLDFVDGVQVLEFDRPGRGRIGSKPCKGSAKKRKKCEKKNGVKTKTAPVMAEWTSSLPIQFPLPTGGTDSGESWGYACRIVPPL